jgi:hypothetical protein
MHLLRLRSSWGIASLNSGEPRRVLAALRSHGWDGMEASLDDIGTDADSRRLCVEAAASEGMSLVLSAYSSWKNYSGSFDAAASVKDHTAHMEQELHQIAELASCVPSTTIIRVNAHSGSDAWSEDEAVDFFGAISELTGRLGDALPPMSHETHRGRYLCCPFATARLLSRVPSVRLTSDFSHWVVKCERMLDTAEECELLGSAIAPAVDHIHARIGTPQAPQVTLPGHQATAVASERHYEWWRSVWSAREAGSISGRDRMLTATIEYGPAEWDSTGEYVGYTPISLQGEPLGGVAHDELLRVARDTLDVHFERWRGESARRRGGW